MTSRLRLSIAGALLFAGAPVAAANPNWATADEVVAKVRLAAALLAARRESAVMVLRQKAPPFTWKDSAVFVLSCAEDKLLAHPHAPDLVGGDIKRHKDFSGQRYGHRLCATATKPGGGWVEYVWLRPGDVMPMRTVAYVMPVKGTPYQVGAPLHDATVSLKALRQVASTTSSTPAN